MFTHIAFYRFCDLQELDTLRVRLVKLLKDLDLKGTLLLAPEGINGMLAGSPTAIDQFKNQFQQIKPFEQIHFKESTYEKIPFQKTMVKIKKEILVFGDESIKPHEFTAPSITPESLDQLLKESPSEVLFLDTRNNYEMNLGKFKNTLSSNIDHFREFPNRVKEWKATDQIAQWANKKIITYCTGGIRCEKASALMIREGFKNVYQLEGGILNYFEKTKANHYDGDCFVFDERLAVDKNLEQAAQARCSKCKTTKPYDGTTNSIRDCGCAS